MVAEDDGLNLGGLDVADLCMQIDDVGRVLVVGHHRVRCIADLGICRDSLGADEKDRSTAPAWVSMVYDPRASSVPLTFAAWVWTSTLVGPPRKLTSPALPFTSSATVAGSVRS